MQGSPFQDRSRQRRTVHESAGQNRICGVAHCMTEQDNGGQCMRVQDRNRICRAVHCRTQQDSGGQCMRAQDRTGHAGQPIPGQNKTEEDSA